MPGAHIRRQMTLQVLFQAFRIFRLPLYGQVQFTTSVRGINRQHYRVTAMLVERLDVVFNLAQFYSEALYLYLCVFAATINEVSVRICQTEIAGPVIKLSGGIRHKTFRRLFGSTPIPAHELRSGNPQFTHLSGRKGFARRGCNPIVHPQKRFPDCRHAVMVFGPFSWDDIRRAVDGRFGRSVQVDDRGIGYARTKFVEQIHVGGLRGDDEIAQVRETDFPEIRTR